MSLFKDTIEKRIPDVEYSNAPATQETLLAIQKKLNCTFGPQLMCYLTEFGYLARGYKEMYGVNERQKMDSDLVKTTEMLHADFPLSRGMVAVDNQGDGDYILCNAQDMVYEFIPSNNNEFYPLGQTLLYYILARLNE